MVAKSVAQKLLVKPGSTLWVSDPGRAELLGDLPEGVVHAPTLPDADVAVLFVDDEPELRVFAEANRAVLGSPRVMWLLYPKGNRISLNRDSLWRLMADYGIRPVTQVAVDEVWSALRFRPLTEAERRASQG